MERDRTGQNPSANMILTRAILRYGEDEVAKRLGISTSTVSRKVNDQEGWKLSQLSELLDILGLEIREKDKADPEIEALRTLARKYLEASC